MRLGFVTVYQHGMISEPYSLHRSHQAVLWWWSVGYQARLLTERFDIEN